MLVATRVSCLDLALTAITLQLILMTTFSSIVKGFHTTLNSSVILASIYGIIYAHISLILQMDPMDYGNASVGLTATRSFYGSRSREDCRLWYLWHYNCAKTRRHGSNGSEQRKVILGHFVLVVLVEYQFLKFRVK